MGFRSVSFDDPDGDNLFVFSGADLLTTHYDVADLDWREVAERSALDERRGLVIAQVAVIEDLVDEFLVYLVDPEAQDEFRSKLDHQTIGPRLDRFEQCLSEADVLDNHAAELLDSLRGVVRRRNELAHGTLHLRPVGGGVPSLQDHFDAEWVIASRRKRTTQRITMLMLREDLNEAIGAFTAMLGYAELFVERAPRPIHFTGGAYLAVLTP